MSSLHICDLIITIIFIFMFHHQIVKIVFFIITVINITYVQ